VGRAAQQALVLAVWPSNKTARLWLVLADESEIAKRLEPALVAACDTVSIVHPEIWHPAMTSGEGLRGQAWWPCREGPNVGPKMVDIVYLGGLDSGEGADVAPGLSSDAALAFLQAAADVDSGRVWLVTRGFSTASIGECRRKPGVHGRPDRAVVV